MYSENLICLKDIVEDTCLMFHRSKPATTSLINILVTTQPQPHIFTYMQICITMHAHSALTFFFYNAPDLVMNTLFDANNGGAAPVN